MNQLNLIGRVASNVRVSETMQKKEEYRSFTLAVTRYENKTDFFNCYCYGKMNKPASYLHKGNLLRLSGSLSIDKKKKTLKVGSEEKDYWTELHRVTVQELEFFPRSESEAKDEDFDNSVSEDDFEHIPFI